MNVNFRQPKYILPLILLPFFCLFFFVYHNSISNKKQGAVPLKNGLNPNVGQVSGDVSKQQLEDKLEAYQNTYKQSDGMSAVSALPAEHSSDPAYDNNYSDKQRRTLDSINQVMRSRYMTTGSPPLTVTGHDRQLAASLNNWQQRQQQTAPAGRTPDPMEAFRKQMAYVDSLSKANDPALKAERQKRNARQKADSLRSAQPHLALHKINADTLGFNTVMPPKEDQFIKVVIDENVTGYAGSRIRLRLLDDIQVGRYRIAKNTYLYALVSGFSGQRVELSVMSVMYGDKILPVKLDVYDLDGLKGLFVPESAFRDFTKDLGQNTVQGVTIDGTGSGSAGSQFMMSTASKLFESTSSAIAGLIRKNKAKIKYNSYLYLIDQEALESAQKTY